MAALAAKVAALGRSPVPLERRLPIRRGFPPVFVVLAHEMHGACMTARGGQPKPYEGGGTILCDTASIGQQVGVVVNGPVAVEGGRAMVPVCGHRIIDRRAEPILVAAADHVHRHRLLVRGRRPGTTAVPPRGCAPLRRR